jgi:hypothetical protein
MRPITSFAAIFAGLPWGLKGVAVAYAVANTITFPVYTWMVTRYVNISLWAVARSLAGVTVAACAMVVATFVVRRALLAAGIPLAPRFILEVLGAAIVYVGTSMLTSREVIREIRSVRARRGEAALTGHV